MSDQIETLVTQDMLDRKGVWSEAKVSPPISDSDIRKWAIAVYWPETPPKIFWDTDYAKTTHWSGIIAPSEFNPFAWPVEKEPTPVGLQTPQGGGVGTRAMNGGQTEEYYAPMRPGDVISSSTALSEWNERTTSLGLTLFSTTETRWVNQRGDLVKIRKSIGIRY